MTYDPKESVLSAEAGTLAMLAAPSGSLEVRAGAAARKTREGAAAAREIRLSGQDSERAPIIRETILLNGRKYDITARPDGIRHEAGGCAVVLIRETDGDVTLTSPGDMPAALAEGVITGFLLSQRKGKIPVSVELVRCNYRTGQVSRVKGDYDFSALEAETASLLDRARPRLDEIIRIKEQGYPAAAALSFPYPEIRPGQKDFISDAYRAILRGRRLLVSAPTGIGKTISALYPALRALDKTGAEKIFYFTSKGTAARTALSTFAALAKGGMPLRCLGLAAKERLCARIHGGHCPASCSPRDCPLANGHFDREAAAIESLLTRGALLTPDDILAEAAKAHVCPYELSLDFSQYCTVLVCDYNYLFDPAAYLRRYFPGSPQDSIFLLDEAHNLPDRVCAMYSRTFSSKTVGALAALPETALYLSFRAALERAGAVLEKLRRLSAENSELDAQGVECGYAVSRRVSAFFLRELSHLEEECGKLLLSDDLPRPLREGASALRRECREWSLCESYTESGFSFVSSYRGTEVTARLLCLDPAPIIDEKLKNARASVLFSATLQPMPYFQALTGCGEAALLSLPSPYEKDNFCVAVMDKISTRYEDRERNLPLIVEAIAATVSARRGNYFVFAPSYAYMDALCQAFHARYPGVRTLSQTRAMRPEERRRFLDAFVPAPRHSTVGFCVMGGIFSESVDLPGDRLIGCILIGNGAGAVTPERGLLQEYYQEKYESGYEYAYLYPGMNRVLQAAGRVIRSEEDRGVAVLIDDRYPSPAYRELMPEHWHSLKYVGDNRTLSVLLRRFWGEDGTEKKDAPPEK